GSGRRRPGRGRMSGTTDRPGRRPGIGRRPVLGGLVGAAAFGLAASKRAGAQAMTQRPEIILRNGKISTLEPAQPAATALAVSEGLVAAVGSDRDIMALAGSDTRVVDLGGRRVIPGLNDSHTHLIRGGLNYNMELRWENVSSLADALAMLKAQAERTPAPQWVRVVGGWSEFQFAERRWPTLEE